MHRLRCRLFAGAALLSASLCTYPAFAQKATGHKSAASSGSQVSSSSTASRLDTRLRFGDGVQTYHPSRRQIGVAYAAGSSDSTPGGQIHFTVDRAKLRAYLSRIAPDVQRRPLDAKVVVAVHNATDDGSAEVPAKVVPGHDGASLETDAAVDQIQKTLQTDPGTLHFVLPVKTTPAHVETSNLSGIDARIGYFVTHFNPGEVGRTETVRRAIDIIDGTVVKPGGIFSVNQTVGERTKARGFGEGIVFVNGHTDKQVGGGMCQVATTLFNAAMLADLKIVERHPHVRTVPYVPAGSDATVYYGQKDFKFQNDTKAPICISYRTTRTHAITAIFGKAVPGRHVVLIRRSQELGPRHFKGSLTRVVYQPGSAKQIGPVFHSAYKWTPALDYSH